MEFTEGQRVRVKREALESVNLMHVWAIEHINREGTLRKPREGTTIHKWSVDYHSGFTITVDDNEIESI